MIDSNKEVKTITKTGSIAITSSNVRIGGHPTGSYYLNGSLDDVRIYNRALSADEIQALYSSSVGRYH